MSSPRKHRTIPRTNPLESSTLHNTDRAFIEFTRCLHQAKNIVKELQAFSASVCPSLCLNPCLDPNVPRKPDARLGNAAYIQHINDYLNDTFRKFSRLCKILLMVLEKMGTNPCVRKERIDSFRSEVHEEWRLAIDVRKHLLNFIQQNISLFDSPSHDLPITDNVFRHAPQTSSSPNPSLSSSSSVPNPLPCSSPSSVTTDT
ncbi:uncharacterized protein BYT42DRAFT_612309 [Radiomyces spectabilis]|uniref:uncharacterized protein n=1 Tax=Radiomyces spectabilis TaxID=64574 RepID=UPI0022205F2C|nr:uncharacterized protein BYT42DRAFT_612309 [Radiomyces spectabilis]KAI8384624.1 hypothetical protein BYT42DRAFT_612309 [Radiomyces spectabilis]